MLSVKTMRASDAFRSIPQAVLVLLFTMTLASCGTDHDRRTGPVFDGSAQWALDIAQPLISGFAPDAQVYVIDGAIVQTDGRLFADAGGWGFMTWSQSLQKMYTVSVKYDGSTTTKTVDRPTPPGRGQPIPAGWLNSPAIFQVANPHVNDAPDQVTLVLVNWDDYPEAPGQAVWGLVYSNPGGTHKVTWDGTYLQ